MTRLRAAYTRLDDVVNHSVLWQVVAALLLALAGYLFSAVWRWE